ncbi:conjugal transfer mating pair stabilization protein TraG [Budviciaceae bacterium BWR-B9]|uniref:Conjugal transfer mating pair stabilization protein TraG n=1 Tax=Limnobaculum allomyrinae TaxID=2791986 RepID=A0ABS1IUU6_9GAMM|nr:MULTISPECIES: conjugal transfer mating-pair stabilization protein TraG [Limnobaculum]MBK5145535.1 conjugal transfer mating pair stabilization protein TraG [Limnobaculum allomyrinae]MBV7693654.1 conjugal transfer mating pair stabilization protein TraG [Limnobaculum sp. M2-1]
MWEMYVITGGDWFRVSFNAIATFMSTSAWTSLVRLATAIGILLTCIDYIRRRDVKVFLYWVFVITLTSSMVNIKRSIQIIDSSQPMAVYHVDNVPMGLVFPSYLFTVMGHSILQGYELVFHTPNSVTYSKGGMLFGAGLVVQSTDFISANPEITGLFSDYVQNCVIGDIYLNHKYSLEDLMNSPDPYTLIFANPSPLRGVFDRDSKFMTCAVASVKLKADLRLDTETGGTTWLYYARSVFGGRPDANILLAEMLGDSYQYFYSSGQSASDIMKKNVTLTALRRGITSYASRSDDTSSLVMLSETSAMSKLRMSQATSTEIAARQIPMLQTVILGVLIGLFPVMVLLGLMNILFVQVWKGFLLTILWLQSWPIMFAILNHAVSFNLQAKLSGTSLTLSNMSTLQQNYSDIATTAGWISTFIPFLSMGLVYGLNRAFSQSGSYTGTSIQGVASQSSSQAVDGTWAFNNLQTDNVQGFKWDTNSATSAGQMSSQTVSGGLMTRTAGGNTVYNSSGAMSQLPVHLGFSNRLGSTFQEQARESEQQSSTFQKGYNDGLTFTSNKAMQLSQQFGNSSSMVQGADSSEGSNKSAAFSKMNAIAEQYAKDNNISKNEAFKQLMDKGTKGTVSADLKVGAKADFGVYANASASGGLQGFSGSSHGTDEKGSQNNSNNHNKNAQMASDFRDSMDVIASDKTSTSGNHTDNNSASQLDQLGYSLNQMRNDFENYSSASTRSHEYSELASRSKDMSAQVESNYDQMFADWVTKQSPENAHDILTNTSSPDIARQREALAQQFVEQELAPRIADDYHTNRDTAGSSMGDVGPTSGRMGAEASYLQGEADIQKRAEEAGINKEVKGDVDNLIKSSKAKITSAKEDTHKKQSEVQGERDNLKREHQSAEQTHKTNYNKERQAQGEKDDYEDVMKNDPRNKNASKRSDPNIEGGGD